MMSQMIFSARNLHYINTVAIIVLALGAWFRPPSTPTVLTPNGAQVSTRDVQLTKPIAPRDIAPRPARQPATDVASPLPAPVSLVKWGERRKFDAAKAEAEGIWKKGTGGLNDVDRAILARIYFESDSVYETGVGESTNLAIFTRVPRYTGVDTSLEWLNNVMEIAPPHYRFHWADVGPVGNWSRPKGRAAKDKFPFASTAALAAESNAFDFYFIDGRFRMASFAMAFLHASAHGRTPSEFMVGIHDMGTRKFSNYRDCLKIGVQVDGNRNTEDDRTLSKETGFVVIFRRRPDVTDSDILKIWQEYQNTMI